MEQQSRSLLYRFIFIAVLILLALWQLYPTYNGARLNKKQAQNFAKVQELANLDVKDIKTALLRKNLESVILNSLKDPSRASEARDLAKKIVALDDQISNNERKTIKRGLDLQGGTFLVYEMDFVNFLSNPNVARNPDRQLIDLLKAVDYQSKHENRDFFDVLPEKFEEKGIPLTRYFGKKGESDSKIISNLRSDSENAIDRALEVLRNRVDQFGVSEPSITKQGSRRIIVELAGILDPERAKGIIGKTAQLEFKLVREPDQTRSIVYKIDNIVKKRRQGLKDTSAVAIDTSVTSANQDTTQRTQKVRDEKEVNLDELFGKSPESVQETAGDTTLSVDKDLFEGNPFIALFAQIPNRRELAVPKQNMKAIDVILNYPEVQDVIPDDSEFLWSKDPERVGDKEYYFLYYVKKTPEITGDYIEDARVSVAGESAGRSRTRVGESEVLLSFNPRGAKDFARITGANVGKFLAIVLDNKVASAPQIRERIPNGQSSITGMRGVEEAKDLVVVLKAGALPARLEGIEERTVGPSLGQDSIQRGQWSGLIGAAIVFIFMIIYYRLSGVIADFAVVLNIGFVLAILAAFHATLTLPGIAGIILMVGMSVDANVLIYERIREELRSGKTIRAAIDIGYKRAFVTILDSNLTTLLTALVLYQFGTGPIQGFAVTLMIGLVANMFTAIFVTRFIFDFITTRFKVKELSI
ncbi:MAG: protein translocase subunit SecD [candidate division KSB1 bacterium]|nr:protein translocase subunit SecD [candidate division KSB1 bacterium]MDZ7333980.1 protein translocase subunit SecD [candidate division KSB1 bacterium]MDZ7357980.1 protein translocase subunit SecD [candidate division KSB1 bacterium]MDZ7399965.1 protein translocase subunit SecD [candidate division KSB1 bacterium]